MENETWDYEKIIGGVALRYSSVTGSIWRFKRATRKRPPMWKKLTPTPGTAGYVRTGIEGKTVGGHWIAWFMVHGVWPKEEIDHENHIRDDNRIGNLREATHLEQARNHSLRTNGILGVRWRPSLQMYEAQIVVNRRIIRLDCFDELTDAITARKAAEAKYGFHPNHGKPPQ